ncbi:MAG: zinc ribbon domain-containing protein [Candidatus Lokiarchaeota archaeon]|nr:zinc ribbon domain-containing protein [Candidatus Lokiarchaeota archaeon]
MNFCPQCGTKIVASWNVCPSCGHNLKSESVYQEPSQVQIPVQAYSQQKPQYQPYAYHPRGSNTNGVVALIFGLLGLFGVLAIVGSIVGIVLGAVGRKKDDDPRMAIAGLILGIIGIVIWIAFFIWLFSFFFMAFRYYPYID